MADVYRKISVEFTRPVGGVPILSWVIRLVQRTTYSHCRLSWLGAGGRVPVVYEASGSYLKFMGPHAIRNRPAKVMVSYPFDLNKTQYGQLVELCMTYAGVDYGKKQLLGIGIARVFGLKKNPFADGRRSQVCSEIIGIFINKILNIDTNLDLDIAGPKEINNFLHNNYGRIVK